MIQEIKDAFKPPKEIVFYEGVPKFYRLSGGEIVAKVCVIKPPSIDPYEVLTPQVTNHSDMAEFGMFETEGIIYCKSDLPDHIKEPA